MKTKMILLLFLGALFTFQANNVHSQVGDKVKNAVNKKKKKDKGVGVEVTEDEKGISGTYYVWFPPSVENSWFKKISQVALQYTPENGKLRLYASKKEYIDYYTASYINKYKLIDACGEYSFRNNYNAPDLWSVEKGVFMQKQDATTNLNTCEAKMQSFDRKSFVMSKDKAFIDELTEEKYAEYMLKLRSSSCSCLQDVKAGQKPLPVRKMRDAGVEKEAMRVVKERATREGWKEEILGVYIASEKWSKSNLWISTGGDWDVAERLNVVIVMSTSGKCKWQRAVIANNEFRAYKSDGSGSEDVEGVSLVGVVPENNPAKCEAVEKILK